MPAPQSQFHDWQQRVIDEKKTIDKNIAALAAFLTSHPLDDPTLPIRTRSLMQAQLMHMQALTAILSERIALFVV